MNKSDFSFTQVKNLDAPYPDIPAVVQQQGHKLSFKSIDGSNWNLGSATTNDLLDKLKQNGTPLKDIVKSDIYSGIKTGFNKLRFSPTIMAGIINKNEPNNTGK